MRDATLAGPGPTGPTDTETFTIPTREKSLGNGRTGRTTRDEGCVDPAKAGCAQPGNLRRFMALVELDQRERRAGR